MRRGGIGWALFRKARLPFPCLVHWYFWKEMVFSGLEFMNHHPPIGSEQGLDFPKFLDRSQMSIIDLNPEGCAAITPF